MLGNLIDPIITIGAFLLMLFILVVIHELGHFLTAVRLGIHVEEFGIGYPPRAMVLFEHNGVKYTLNWLPLGGFVRFGSGGDNSLYGAGSLSEAHPWTKIPVMLAGPLMNLLLAIVIFAILSMTVGLPTTTGHQFISEIYPETPAAAAGFQVEDQLISLDGRSLEDGAVISEIARQNLNVPITAVVLRDGEEVSLTVVPGPWTTPDGETLPVGLGIGYNLHREFRQTTNPIEATISGSAYTYDLLGQMFNGLARLPAAIGGLFNPDDQGAEEPIGPVGIARATGEVIRQDGGFLAFWNLTAILSLNLFLLNLLPIPALDGSHIIFSLIEWVRGGKKVPPEKEALVHALGFAALMGLMVLITVNDVIKAVTNVPVLGGG